MNTGDSEKHIDKKVVKVYSLKYIIFYAMLNKTPRFLLMRINWLEEKEKEKEKICRKN